MRAFNLILGLVIILAAAAGAEWQVETVAEVGCDPDIFLRKNGDLCIIYRVPTYPTWSETRYVGKGEYGQTNWPATKLEAGGPLGYKISRCLDGKGRVHVSFYVGDSAELKYGCWAGERWNIETIAQGDGLEIASAIAVDSKGRPCIAYACEGVKYARRDGEKWLKEDITDRGICPTMVVDASDGVHVAFYDRYDAKVKYSRRTEDGWETEDVYTGRFYYDELTVSLAVDTSGKASLSFFDGLFGDLKYALREGTQWVVETIDKRGWAGDRSSLILDDRGEPYIIYHVEWGLRAARKVNGDWSTIPVAYSGKEYEWKPVYFSVALDRSGRPIVAYDYDDVKIATWVGSDWPERVDEPAMACEDKSDAVSLGSWYPAAFAVTREYPWRKKGGWDLRAVSDYEADVTGSIPYNNDVRIIGGVSNYVPYEDLWEQEMEIYETWLRVKSGRLEGWVPSGGLPNPEYFKPTESPGDGNVAYVGDYSLDPAMAFFGGNFAPLREGPSFESSSIVEEKGGDNEEWLLRPEVEAGSIFDVVARCRDWLCVGVGENGAWLPATTPGFEIFYLTAFWIFSDELLKFKYYFPLGDDVTQVIISYHAYFKLGRIPQEDPELKVVTNSGEFVAEIEYYGARVSYETGRGFLTASFPCAVKRNEIKSFSFATGAEPYRKGFTVDPRPAWAEYDAER